MKTYHLTDPQSIFSKIITGYDDSVIFMLSNNRELTIKGPDLFTFLLKQIILENIDPFLASTILDDHPHLFSHYSQDKMDLGLLLGISTFFDNSPETFKTDGLECLSNFDSAMKNNPLDINLPLKLVNYLVEARQYAVALFSYKALVLFTDKTEQQDLRDSIIDQANALYKKAEVFKTPYSTTEYQSSYTAKLEPSRTFIQPSYYYNEEQHLESILEQSREEYELQQAIALSKQEFAPKIVPNHFFSLTESRNRKELASINTKDLIDILNLPEDYLPGSAVDDGGCFFDSLAQILNLIHNSTTYSEQYLRTLCFDYYLEHKDFVNHLHEQDYSDKTKSIPYKMIIHSADSLGDNSTPIWGRAHVEGRILCLALEDKIMPAIHVIDLLLNPETNKYIPTHSRYTKLGQEPVNPKNFFKKNIPTLVLSQEDRHYIPMQPIFMEEDNEQEWTSALTV